MTKNICFFLVLCIAAGCGGEPDEDDGLAELGTGTIEFEPVTPGQDLGLVAGPQGGFHFLAHARMMGLDPGDPLDPDPASAPLTSFQVFARDGTRLDAREPPRQLAYEATEDGWFALPSARILLIVNDAVPAIYDTTVEIALRIEDASGAVATDAVQVRVVPAEAP